MEVKPKCGTCGSELQDHECAWPNYGYCDACVDRGDQEESYPAHERSNYYR